MIDAIVALIGESYFVLVCNDLENDTYLGIAECSDEKQAFLIRDALDAWISIDMHNLGYDHNPCSYGGSE